MTLRRLGGPHYHVLVNGKKLRNIGYRNKDHAVRVAAERRGQLVKCALSCGLDALRPVYPGDNA